MDNDAGEPLGDKANWSFGTPMSPVGPARDAGEREA